jgi:arylsulfatase
VHVEFDYDDGGIATGGTVTLYIDGKKCGEGRVEETEPMQFSAAETCDIGNDFGSPLCHGVAVSAYVAGSPNRAAGHL